MILTKEKGYVLSLELEDCSSESGLAHKMIELEFTNKELLHAVITCGMPVQRLMPACMNTRKMEILYKLFLVETALEVNGDRLQKSKNTAYLDSSEKSVISYYLGMFFTKLVSRKLFGIDYLAHLNTVRDKNGEGYIDYFDKEWRQDMIGYQVQGSFWSVWEAKGGSNKRVQALERGRQQLSAIAAVNDRKPDPSAVCMTYYDHGYLCAIVQNQESKSGEHLDISEAQYFDAYYRPVFETFQEFGMQMRGKNAEICLRIPQYFQKNGGREREICVGMPVNLMQCIAEKRYEELANLLSEDGETPLDGQYKGSDGIYIR